MKLRTKRALAFYAALALLVAVIGSAIWAFTVWAWPETPPVPFGPPQDSFFLLVHAVSASGLPPSPPVPDFTSPAWWDGHDVYLGRVTAFDGYDVEYHPENWTPELTFALVDVFAGADLWPRRYIMERNFRVARWSVAAANIHWVGSFVPGDRIVIVRNNGKPVNPDVVKLTSSSQEHFLDDHPTEVIVAFPAATDALVKSLQTIADLRKNPSLKTWLAGALADDNLVSTYALNQLLNMKGAVAAPDGYLAKVQAVANDPKREAVNRVLADRLALKLHGLNGDSAG